MTIYDPELYSKEHIKIPVKCKDLPQNKYVGKYFGDTFHWADRPFDKNKADIVFVEKYDEETEQYRLIHYKWGEGIKKVSYKIWTKLGIVETDDFEVIQENGKWKWKIEKAFGIDRTEYIPNEKKYKQKREPV
jgi:hypothetical protein